MIIDFNFWLGYAVGFIAGSLFVFLIFLSFLYRFMRILRLI